MCAGSQETGNSECAPPDLHPTHIRTLSNHGTIASGDSRACVARASICGAPTGTHIPTFGARWQCTVYQSLTQKHTQLRPLCGRWVSGGTSGALTYRTADNVWCAQHVLFHICHLHHLLIIMSRFGRRCCISPIMI
jgi:hypothetical protein